MLFSSQVQTLSVVNILASLGAALKGQAKFYVFILSKFMLTHIDSCCSVNGLSGRHIGFIGRCCFAGSAAALSRALLQSQLQLHSCYSGHSPVQSQGWLLAAPTQKQAKVRGVVVRLTLTASSAQMRGVLESTPTSFAGPGTRTGSRGASQR